MSEPRAAADSPLAAVVARLVGCGDGAEDPRVMEATLAAARRARERIDASEHITYVRVPVPDRAAAATIAAAGAVVDQLRVEERATGWWWLEKVDDDGHHLRIRVHGPSPLRAEDLTDATLGEGPPRLLTYEPEMALFGGPSGVELAHRFHQRDAELLRGVRCRPAPARRAPAGLTVRAMEALLRGAALDAFERWDAWQLAARLRPLPLDADDAELARNTRWASDVLAAAEHDIAVADSPFAGYAEVGEALATAHRAGRLERTPRQMAAALLIFHANRAGHPPAVQRHLTHAMARARDPMGPGHPARRERADK